MLYDREYMREPASHRARASVALLWILAGCFVVQSALWIYGRVDLAGPLGLSRGGIAQGRVWQFLSYQFLHAVPLPFHVLGNCLGLYFFGRSVEEALGTRRFLAFYFGGGFVGGLFFLGLDFAARRLGSPGVVGASAGVMALAAAFCRLYPDRELSLFVYFFPVNLRARTLLWILGGVSALGALLPWDSVAHAAHLGGLVVGYLGIGALEPDGWWSRWQESRRSRPMRPAGPGRRETRVVPETPGAFVSSEVDPILDKIAAQGMHSLTDGERRILESARRKIAGR
ncbi:MAG: rhomboid family intramembrane serine protease [Verrucomicrobia bacterium]|nr:MAG: rhomboid family intramembrane serine protease [Verrucomicrobiota bacterium]